MVRFILVLIVLFLAYRGCVSLMEGNSQPPPPTRTPSPKSTRPPATTTPPAATETPVAETTPTSTPTTKPTADSTPTTEESLSNLILCHTKVKAMKTMQWGQAPGLVYSDDPRVTGKIKIGDYIQVLTPNPNEHGEIRVKVFPHDYREVGKTDDMVWISWKVITRFRLDLQAFSCEE